MSLSIIPNSIPDLTPGTSTFAGGTPVAQVLGDDDDNTGLEILSSPGFFEVTFSSQGVDLNFDSSEVTFQYTMILIGGGTKGSMEVTFAGSTLIGTFEGAISAPQIIQHDLPTGINPEGLFTEPFRITADISDTRISEVRLIVPVESGGFLHIKTGLVQLNSESGKVSL